MDKLRVSIVEYTNSLPFIWGLTHSGFIDQIELTKDNPAVCAEKLTTGQADIGLVPVATLPYIPHAQIIGDYCIGANGPVHSVFLFSDKPIREVKTIRLDLQSRSSNQLTKVLAKNYWEIDPIYTKGVDINSDAFVEIGDRTFGKLKQYKFAYDLAGEWKKWTGLPFVFAAWVANKPIDEGFQKRFNEALAYGIDRRAECIQTISPSANFDVSDYLMNKISYQLTAEKLDALRLFLGLIENT